jgi:hypothetical protein
MEFDVQTSDRQNRGILLFTFAETENPSAPTASIAITSAGGKGVQG